MLIKCYSYLAKNECPNNSSAVALFVGSGSKHLKYKRILYCSFIIIFSRKCWIKTTNSDSFLQIRADPMNPFELFPGKNHTNRYGFGGILMNENYVKIRKNCTLKMMPFHSNAKRLPKVFAKYFDRILILKTHVKCIDNNIFCSLRVDPLSKKKKEGSTKKAQPQLATPTLALLIVLILCSNNM